MLPFRSFRNRRQPPECPAMSSDRFGQTQNNRGPYPLTSKSDLNLFRDAKGITALNLDVVRSPILRS